MDQNTLKERFEKAAASGMNMMNMEQHIALQNRYVAFQDAVAIGLDPNEKEAMRNRVIGGIDLLTEMGVIADDEEFMMLLNDIEEGA